jgi:peptide-methionine (R)-S-oxide reductase
MANHLHTCRLDRWRLSLDSLEEMPDMTRRDLLSVVGAALGLGALSRVFGRGPAVVSADSGNTFEVTMADAEWRRRLTPAQYAVLRQHGTEWAWSSPLNREHRKGTFLCAACALPLFSSSTKFDSGTGWPSFWAPLEGAVRTTTDRALLEVRTEVHCRRCGGHLGHVFDDGPAPTGKRYCMNGVAMTFSPSN